MLSGASIEVVALVAAFAIAVITTPAGVSGAVLLLPFQVSVLGTPSPVGDADEPAPQRARPADLPVEATHLVRHCLVGLGRRQRRRLPAVPGWWALRRGEHS